MATEFSIQQIINYAKIGQYTSIEENAIKKIFQGRVLDDRYAQKIYFLRKNVEFMYNSTPNLPSLRRVAEYLYSLVRPFNLLQATISITNPGSQSVLVGQSASFNVNVTVSNGQPFTVQWFRNGVAIPGATGLSYTVASAQLSDNGALFSASATSVGIGTVTSNTANLIVTQAIIGFFAYSATTDFYPVISGGSDPFTYPTSFSITHNAAISFGLPGAMPSNQFMVVKIPVSEPVKANWFNTPLNNGTIPDPVFQSVALLGGYNYYCSRGQISMDVTQNLQLS